MSPTKRPNEDAPRAFDLTPRPSRTRSTPTQSNANHGATDDADTTDSQSHRSAATSTSRTSSKAPKVSRNSSPTKQFRNAEIQETGFRTASFDTGGRMASHLPASLRSLLRDLRKIERADGVLPECLRDELSDFDIPWFAFHNAQRPESLPNFTYPPITFIQDVYGRATKCREQRHRESSWNIEVHARVLEWVLRDSGHNGPLDYRYCTTANVLHQYRPRDAPSKMVDFCLALEMKEADEEVVNRLCKQTDRPGYSINHTDWGDLCKHPIAISIETKCPGDSYDEALLQVATWHAAQLRSLAWAAGERRPRNTLSPSAHGIDYLPALIVTGNEWSFVATVPGNETDSRPTVFQSQIIGSTSSILGIYTLLAALQRLRSWAEEEYWPVFKAGSRNSPER
uniref:PD-(D/E)XK nuclease-like domain-containing protein n=1 Tax=Bionectria ochroleuca TaxID=29856 RepID=A0A0B7KKZ3_BIOOC